MQEYSLPKSSPIPLTPNFNSMCEEFPVSRWTLKGPKVYNFLELSSLTISKIKFSHTTGSHAKPTATAQRCQPLKT